MAYQVVNAVILKMYGKLSIKGCPHEVEISKENFEDPHLEDFLQKSSGAIVVRYDYDDRNFMDSTMFYRIRTHFVDPNEAMRYKLML
jgi:hypothetical protein